jgi:hypothetical protein
LKKEGDKLDLAKNEWEILIELAYAEFTLACHDEMWFEIIEGSRSTRFPNGDAALAWKILNKKFEPRISSNLMAIKKEFSQCALKRDRETQRIGSTNFF